MSNKKKCIYPTVQFIVENDKGLYWKYYNTTGMLGRDDWEHEPDPWTDKVDDARMFSLPRFAEMSITGRSTNYKIIPIIFWVTRMTKAHRWALREQEKLSLIHDMEDLHQRYQYT